MPMYQFGSGTLWGVRTDVGIPTPVKFGALQEVSIDLSSTTKELYAGNQFPVAIARGTGKITGKAKIGQIHGRLLAELFFGGTLATGRPSVIVNNEMQTVPSAGPYVVTAAKATQIVDDLGVILGDYGTSLRRVGTPWENGQYSVDLNTGTYTFYASEAGKDVRLSYTHAVTSGQSVTIVNKPLGQQPVFSVALETAYTAPSGIKTASLILKSCVSTKLTIPTKLDDFVISEFDFSAFADDTGEILTWNFSEAS